MQVRDNIFRKFVRTDDLNNKLQHHNKYKKYRNLITILIKLSKKLYYCNHFNVNINNSKLTWDIINELINKKPKNKQDDIILNINGTKQNDPDAISNDFNKFFTNVASKIQTDIPKIGNF